MKQKNSFAKLFFVFNVKIFDLKNFGINPLSIDKLLKK